MTLSQQFINNEQQSANYTENGTHSNGIVETQASLKNEELISNQKNGIDAQKINLDNSTV